MVTARVPQELGKILQALGQSALAVNFVVSVGEVIVLVRWAGHCYRFLVKHWKACFGGALMLCTD